jgi:hypothetical protein
MQAGTEYIAVQFHKGQFWTCRKLTASDDKASPLDRQVSKAVSWPGIHTADRLIWTLRRRGYKQPVAVLHSGRWAWYL